MAGERKKSGEVEARMKECSSTNGAELNLASCGLAIVPSDAYFFINLRTLNLANNGLTFIDQSLGKLVKLEIINLSNNLLKKIPLSIGLLKGLKKLNLKKNRINEISTELTELFALEELYLSNNQIEEIPQEMINLKSLKTLDLSGNKFTGFPEGFDLPEFPELEMINLKNNPDLEPSHIPWKIRCLFERYPIAHDNEFRKKLVRRNLDHRARVAANLLEHQLKEGTTPLLESVSQKLAAAGKGGRK